MIPKKVHYCWFGNNPYPPLVKDCMKSWTKYLADFELKKWDESNSPMDNIVVQKAIAMKKWAFASDYVRLYALYHEGGVYLDTDMEILKDIAYLLNQKGFFGYEDEIHISAGIIGSQPRSELIKLIMDKLEEKVKANLPFLPIPQIITEIIRGLPENSLIVENMSFYPPSYFYPYNPYANERKELLFSDIVENTYAIHHWSASWIDEKPLWRIAGSRLKKHLVNKN